MLLAAVAHKHAAFNATLTFDVVKRELFYLMSAMSYRLMYNPLRISFFLLFQGCHIVKVNTSKKSVHSFLYHTAKSNQS